MAEQDILFDTDGAACYLGGLDNPLSRRTLERWRTEGAGPEYLKVGNAVRYPKSGLDAFKERCRRSSTSTPASLEVV